MKDMTIRGGKNRILHKVPVSADRWTMAKRQQFLDALADSCNVSQSVKAVGMSLRGLYALRRSDPVFAALWAEALRIGYERLEETLLRQALVGVNRIEIGGVGEGAATTDAPTVVASGTQRPLTTDEIKLAMFLLTRYRATIDGEQGRQPQPRRASTDEVNAALTAKLDALDKRRKLGE